jgi:transcriptional regulator with XRE-family HTH domain
MVKNITTIANSLWTYRKKMGLSQKRVAHLLGLYGTNGLSRWEHGVKLPNLVNLLKLEIVYRVPAGFLFGDLYRKLRDEIRGREEKLKKDLASEG